MSIAEHKSMIKDNGGSRSGTDRRRFVRSENNPERRSGEDRRQGVDRRNGYGQRRRRQNPGNLCPVERRDYFRRIDPHARTGIFASGGR